MVNNLLPLVGSLTEGANNLSKQNFDIIHILSLVKNVMLAFTSGFRNRITLKTPATVNDKSNSFDVNNRK